MERIGVAPGTEIGGYRVLGPLGQGGMGAVYRAVDGDGVVVALKLLHQHLAADPDARARLTREVANLQRVRHPGVARVLDAEIDQAEAFVVTELVDGLDLAALVRAGGPLGEPALGALAADLHDALTAVHAAGVLHRDLTPGNVMVADRGAVLIDFGIAQAAEDARLTSTGFVAGTPGYLSPEALAGGEPGVAGDWWGWAALLAFAATGRPPFGVRPLTAVLTRVRAGEPDLEGVRPGVAAVLRAALAPDPGRRPAPDEVLSRLVAALEADDDVTELVGAEAATQVLGADTAASALVAAPTAVTAVLAGGVPAPGAAPPAPVPPAVVAGPPLPPPPPAWPATGGSTAVLPVTGPLPQDDQDQPWDAPEGAEHAGADAEAWDGDQADDGAWDPGAAPGPQGPDPLDPDDLPPRRVGTVFALGAVAVAAGAVRPGVALLAVVALAVLSRSVGLSAHALRRRRARRGTRRGDVAAVTAAWPWYLLRALVGTVPAVLVAVSSVLVVGGAGWWLLATRLTVVPAPPGEVPGLGGNVAWLTPALLALAVLVGALVVWFGPMSRTTRDGARHALATLAPGAAGAAAVVLVALAVAVVLVVVVLQGEPTAWWPLPGPPDLG